jgi:cell division protein FtsW
VVTTRENSVADYIAVVVVVLMAIGTVFVFSAGSNINQQLNLRDFYSFQSLRQILFFPLAVAIMYAVSLFDYRRLSLANGWFKSATFYLLLFSIALLILVLIPRFGAEINQARRWLRFPVGPVSVSFQPSELAKWSLVFFLAGFCDKFCDSIKLYWKRFVPACLLIGTVAALVIIEDFGTAAFITLLGLLMLIIAGSKWWHVLTPLPFALVGFLVALLRFPGRMRRIADSTGLRRAVGKRSGQRYLQIRPSARGHNGFCFCHYRGRTGLRRHRPCDWIVYRVCLAGNPGCRPL